MSEFKAGDKVYYPTVTNAIVKLERSVQLEDCPLLGEWYSCDNVTKCVSHFLSDGRLNFFHRHSSIFPATQEWYDKLVHVYPDLEKPPARKTPKEIIQAMLDGGWNLVNYRIYSNAQQALNDRKKNKVITRQNFHTMNCDDYFTRYAYCNIEVIDPRTGKTIIDYVDGEIVLED